MNVGLGVPRSGLGVFLGLTASGIDPKSELFTRKSCLHLHLFLAIAIRSVVFVSVPQSLSRLKLHHKIWRRST